MRKLYNYYWSDDKGLLFLLIAIFILIFIIYPLSGNSEMGSVIANVFIIFILLTGVISVDIDKKYRYKLIIFLIFLIVGSIFADKFITDSVIHLHIFIRIIFLWLLVILIFKKVFRNRPISFFFRIAGSITIYLLIGFIWANMLFILYHFYPASFQFTVKINPDENTMFNFIYYSFETLTTLGYGDILPLTPLAKILIILEALIGPLYLAILIGRLVSKQTVPMNK